MNVRKNNTKTRIIRIKNNEYNLSIRIQTNLFLNLEFVSIAQKYFFL